MRKLLFVFVLLPIHCLEASSENRSPNGLPDALYLVILNHITPTEKSWYLGIPLQEELACSESPETTEKPGLSNPGGGRRHEKKSVSPEIQHALKSLQRAKTYNRGPRFRKPKTHKELTKEIIQSQQEAKKYTCEEKYRNRQKRNKKKPNRQTPEPAKLPREKRGLAFRVFHGKSTHPNQRK